MDDTQAQNIFMNFWNGLKGLLTERKNITRPYPNEHAARITDPEKYDEFARKNDEFGAGVDVIYGVKDGKSEVQAIRFDVKKFTPDEAKAWLKDHDYADIIEFEDAEQDEEMKEEKRAVSFDTMMGQLWENAQEKYPMAYFVNAFTDDDGSIYGLMNEEGHLYRCPVTVANGQAELGEREEVTMEFQPVATRTLIRQLPDGKFRWISRSATSVLNRVGEIDSKDLFDSFVVNIERTGKYPVRQFYHQGEQFRTGVADFVARDGDVLITSGVYDDSELAKREIAAIQSNPSYWGESIGYLPMQQPELLKVNDGVSIPVYRTGVFKDISMLPENEAANLFTIVYSMEVKRMLKGKIRDAFVKLFGDNEDEANKWLNENVEELNRSIQDDGLITRTAKDKPVEEVGKPISTDIELNEAAVNAIVTRVMESETIAPVIEVAMQHEIIVKLRAAVDGLIAKTTELEQKLNDAQAHIANLEQTDNDKKRQWLEDAPAKSVAKVTYKPRQVQTENGVVPANEIAKTLRPKVAY
jgi:arsenate reductase-like glutaredoxin family protein